MKGYTKFIARVDSTPVGEVTRQELRTRIELLDAELSQLAHDEKHVRDECYGMEQFHHLRKIAAEQEDAKAVRQMYLVELSGRSL